MTCQSRCCSTIPMVNLLEESGRQSNGALLSPPPEEIKLKMPDMSALNIGDNSLHNSILNDSAHFNLDDFLGIKKSEGQSGLLQRPNTNTISNNPSNNIIVNLDNSGNGDHKTGSNFRTSSLQNQPLLFPTSPLVKKQQFTITGAESAENPAHLLQVILKFVEDKGTFDSDDIGEFLRDLIALVERTELSINFGRLSSQIKEKSKTLEDKRHRIIALSNLTRRKNGGASVGHPRD
jgi:hypothetical protein